MRIQIISKKSNPLIGWLTREGYEITGTRPDYAIEVVESEGVLSTQVVIQTGNVELETVLIDKLKELGIDGFFLDKDTKPPAPPLSDRRLKLTISDKCVVDIERGVFRALTEVLKSKRRRWYNYLIPFVFLFSLTSNLYSQDRFTFIRLWTSSGPVYAADFANNAMRVNCISGCSAGASFADNSAFTFNTTPITNVGFVVDDVGTNVVAENSAGAARMSGQRILYADLSKTLANVNKLLVTPDSVALPANQSVNVAQFGGNNIVTGTGASGTGIPRVTVANDSTVILGTGAAVIGSLTANQSINLAQVAGTATVNGGLAGTLSIGGTAGNNAAITQNPDLIGIEALSTQPAAATTGNQRRLVGSLDGALYVRPGGPVPWACSQDNIGATLTQCQAAPTAGLKLYLTDIVIASTTATAGQFLIRYGTGSNCVTGTTSLFPSAATVVRFPYPANTSTIGSTTISLTAPVSAAAANAICILCVATNTCTVQMSGYTAP